MEPASRPPAEYRLQSFAGPPYPTSASPTAAPLSYRFVRIADMARQLQVAIDCAEPERLARFWVQVLDYRPADPPAGFASWAAFSAKYGAAGEAWCALADADGVGPRLLFHRVPEPKLTKNRLHLDVRVSRGSSGTERPAVVDAEVRRLVAIGGTHLRTVADETDYFAVLQDPEGNEFCVN
jgi:hypothetical protein